MVEQPTRSRVDEFWSSTLGTSVTDLHSPGVTVRANPPSRQAWRGVYVIAFEGAIVYAPADEVPAIAATVSGLGADEVLEAKTWQEVLGSRAQAIFGPVRHCYLDRADGLAELAAGRRLNPTDSDALGKLRSSVAAREWQITGFTAQPAMIFGIFEGDTLAAAANLTAGPSVSPASTVGGPGAATDIGIIVHPAARGRGHGVRIAALAARQAIVMHGVARYRALTADPSTMAIADKLGFAEYGRNLVAYLNDQPLGSEPPIV